MSPKKKAAEYLQYLHKKRNYRRDLLKDNDLEQITKLENDLNEFIKLPREKQKNTAANKLGEFEKSLGKLLPQSKNEGWSENVEVILTAVVLALALKAFFLAPFKIPTGSMQPTLYGITTQSMEDEEMPNPLIQVIDSAIAGTAYHRIAVKSPGRIESIQPTSLLGIIDWVTIELGGVKYRTFCTLSAFYEGLAMQSGTRITGGNIGNLRFEAGDLLVNFKSKTGDRLLVNRMIYHFTRPEVGQVFVFNTQGIKGIEDENTNYRNIDFAQFYIKRCTGIPGSNLSINPPYLLNDGEIVRPEGYEESFDRIYSSENGYRGYALFNKGPYRAILDDISDKVRLKEDEYFAMGDNSYQSSDSRKWGKV
ncbi:MAG: signal peptidase I, partial [Verrucomicrobiota bacterium]